MEVIWRGVQAALNGEESEKRNLEDWGENIPYIELFTGQSIRFGVESFPLGKRHVEVAAMRGHSSHEQLPLHRHP